MKILKNNKGLIIFYLCIIAFTMVWVINVDKTNDKIMIEKNESILSSNV